MKRIVAWSTIVSLSTFSTVGAQDARPTNALANPAVVLAGLDHPTAVAIQPVTGEIFIADSGTGRVIRVTDGKQQSVVTGFPTESNRTAPTVAFRPLPLAFMSRDVLAVGGGGGMDGADLLRFYRVPAAGVSIQADDAFRTLDPIKPKPATTGGGGHVHGVAVADYAVYVTFNDLDGHGRINRVKIADSTPTGKLVRFAATGKSFGPGIPRGITLTHNGHLLVAQSGETTKANDSAISFHRGRDGRELLTLATGLHDITGLAYSPASGRLYATDCAWNEPKSAGLYRLDRDFVGDRQVCKPTLMANLERPTALAFGKQGELYVTLLGPKTSGTKPSKLVRFPKGL